jgi:hypothetical protein
VGFCALCVALVFAGFSGTAAADTDPDGSAGDGGGPAETGQEADTTATGSTGTKPAVGAVGLVDTVPPLIGSFGAGSTLESDPGELSSQDNTRQTGETQASGLAGPMSIGVPIGSQTGTGAAAPTTTDTTKGSDATATTAAVEQTTEPQVVVSASPVTTAPPAPEPLAAEAVPPPPPPADTAPTTETVAVQPVATEAVTAVEPAPSTSPEPPAAAPVIGAAAGGDIMKVLTYLFIALPGDHTSLLALPNKLLSLLGFPLIGDKPASLTAGGIGGSLYAGRSFGEVGTHLLTSRPVQAVWPELLAAAGHTPEVLSAPPARPTVEGVSARGVKQEHLSVALTDSVVPEQVRSVVRHAVGAVLAPFSLLVLALLASPGVAGLVLLGAAGTFVGYRQAKAASILRAVGIARFVKSGPLGVVRSGSLVAVHSRSSKASRPQRGQDAKPLESVA